jgi:hypothetical protein
LKLFDSLPAFANLTQYAKVDVGIDNLVATLDTDKLPSTTIFTASSLNSSVNQHKVDFVPFETPLSSLKKYIPFVLLGI